MATKSGIIHRTNGTSPRVERVYALNKFLGQTGFGPGPLNVDNHENRRFWDKQVQYAPHTIVKTLPKKG